MRDIVCPGVNPPAPRRWREHRDPAGVDVGIDRIDELDAPPGAPIDLELHAGVHANNVVRNVDTANNIGALQLGEKRAADLGVSVHGGRVASAFNRYSSDSSNHDAGQMLPLRCGEAC
jgi:hypothetical protein